MNKTRYFCKSQIPKTSTMTGKNSGIKYKGGWQHGSVILQKLEGPIGDGTVDYPNGDRFEGSFHLSYAHINGPAYAADGRYQFSDGSVIEHAWINTSKDLEHMFLIGVYRVIHRNGPDTLSPFYAHKRNGWELVLAEKPYAIEWYEDEKLQEQQVQSYHYEQLDKNRCVLTINLNDGTIITQSSGKLEQNQYDKWVFQTGLRNTITFPDGSSIDCYGYNLKNLMPYDGWITIHSTNGKYHAEEWNNGKLMQTQTEKWDESHAKEAELPDPFNKANKSKALVWDGHIKYLYELWSYDGEMSNGLPNGYGVLIGDEVGNKGRRYEGWFKDGLCDGLGVFTYPEGGITQDGEWVEGMFQEADAPTESIILNVWLHGDDTEKKQVEAKIGKFPYFTGFGGLRIDRIERRCITFAFYENIKLLTPGETIHFYNEIEGREDHDGCVYESYDYYLDITWKE